MATEVNKRYVVDPDWLDRINKTSDVEMVEAKFVIPKILYDRFIEPKTFLGDVPTKAIPLSFSKRLTRYILNYHKLVNIKEEGLIKEFLNINAVESIIRDYDDGKITFDQLVESIKKIDKD